MTMKISEEEYWRFFTDIKFRNLPLPSTGEVFQMPLVAEKAIHWKYSSYSARGPGSFLKCSRLRAGKNEHAAVDPG
jgi:hypothetical protein